MDRKPEIGKYAGKAADAAAGTVVGAVGLAAKIIVTVLLVILTTILLLGCVFAFYVKTCLTEDLDVSLTERTTNSRKPASSTARPARAFMRNWPRCTARKTAFGWTSTTCRTTS